MAKTDHYNIRKGAMGDAKIIAEYNIRMAVETENLNLDPDTVLRGVKAIFKDPHKGFYLLAETRGQIIGQLMITKEWSDWRNSFFWWIQSVYIHPDYREKQIFSDLYDTLKEMVALKKNVTGLRLYVDVGNQKAKTAYEAQGMYKANYDLYEALL